MMKFTSILLLTSFLSLVLFSSFWGVANARLGGNSILRFLEGENDNDDNSNDSDDGDNGSNDTLGGTQSCMPNGMVCFSNANCCSDSCDW
eukprot:CAMPEP_0178733236 /NCGR_PEP_ID=MMETSP0744-20121128/685_1 /TAXON_ID=913974 /ORGANISM="Nitzschia punctata, Strain CCMP561" /LENGTH=89 /DNA_ID=CAMNT_0020385401 /DNA_START=46 /DNA_END=312 /DNA_ORIENTATION=-